MYSLGNSRYRPKESTAEVCRFNGSVLQIAAGSSHFLVLTEDDGLHAFGGSSYGQLGLPPNLGTFVNRVTRIEGKLAAHKIVQISVGGYHNLALTDTGVVFAWGAGGNGQLGGGGTPRSVPQPEPVKALLDMGVQANFIACGISHSIALGRDGKMYVWGRNSAGQCGAPSGGNILLPRSFSPSGKDIQFVYATAGFESSKVIDTTGQVLNYGSIWNQEPAEDLSTISKLCVHQIWCGHYHVAALVASTPKIFVAQSTHSLDFHALYESASHPDTISVVLHGKPTPSWRVHRFFVQAVQWHRFLSDDNSRIELPSEIPPELLDHMIRWYYQYYCCVPTSLLHQLRRFCVTLGLPVLEAQVEVQIAAAERRVSQKVAGATDPSDVVYMSILSSVSQTLLCFHMFRLNLDISP